jgi:hypothetical protein
MKSIVFLLEEESMKEFLDGLLPRILPLDNMYYQLIPHEGKSDLKKSIPRKLRAWRRPKTKFVILIDQDTKECVELKQEISKLCVSTSHSTLVRIVCKELEAWYLGDLNVLENFVSNKRIITKSTLKRYQQPDNIDNPENELIKLCGRYSKVRDSRIIGPQIDYTNNKSYSFKIFIEGLLTLLESEW